MYGLGISGGKKENIKMNEGLKNIMEIEEVKKEADSLMIKKISDYETRIAELLELDNSHQKINGKMQLRITELEQDNLELHADNKKQSNQINDYIDKIHKMNNKVDQLRKDGVL